MALSRPKGHYKERGKRGRVEKEEVALGADVRRKERKGER